MADIRELMILSPGVLETAPERGLNRALTGLRMALRRAVVRTSRNPLLRALYRSIYNAHLWLASELGRRYAGTRAVYLSSGMASGEWNIGISDIDIAMYGDWPDKRQFRLMKIFGLLTLLSPLFDRRSLASISSIEDMRHLCATDMFMALNHAIGARQWKLLYGEDVLATLPEIPAERFAGCVYMDVRRWWSMLARTTFGQDITSRDALFQNTICFKSVAGMLKAEKMLGNGGFDSTSRQQLIEQEFQRSSDPTLQILLQSERKQFLEIERDPRGPSLLWFLSRAERFHKLARDRPSFNSVAPMKREGAADERFIAPETLALTHRLAEIARAEWKSFRAAYLAPAIVMSSPDSLALLLEVDGDLPTAEQMSHVLAERFRGSLPQRLALYLLLPEAAYQLDGAGALDFFHYTLTAQTAPDVFIALAQPEFLLFGEPRSHIDQPRWSAMAQELMLEELNARRGAYARFGISSRPIAIENLRNLWRYLQLTAIEQSAAQGEIRLPTTFAAIRRALLEWAPDVEADLRDLEQACTRSMSDASANPDALLHRIYARFSESERART